MARNKKREQNSLCSLIATLSQPMEPITTGMSPSVSSFSLQSMIFDIYGTLFISAAGDIQADSAEKDEHSFWQALRDGDLTPDGTQGGGQYGVQMLRREISSAHLDGHLKGVSCPEVDILRIWHSVLRGLGYGTLENRQVARIAVSFECRTNPVWPMPGLLEALAALRKRGIIMGLLSNAQFYTPLLFNALLGCSPEQLGISSRYSLFSYQEGVAKPSPTLFRRLQHRMEEDGLRPEKTLFVGNDMLKDILPATGVGWKTALFAGDRRSLRLRDDDWRAAQAKPDLLISDLRQLVSVVNA
jgi:putative hydrolase of the HAD superfamily